MIRFLTLTCSLSVIVKHMTIFPHYRIVGESSCIKVGCFCWKWEQFSDTMDNDGSAEDSAY